MQTKNTHGGKRDGSGRPKNISEKETITISFRVYEFAAPAIKKYLNSLSIQERTKELLKMQGVDFDKKKLKPF